jgi:GNAT superfamily N-acetyltransferase
MKQGKLETLNRFGRFLRILGRKDEDWLMEWKYRDYLLTDDPDRVDLDVVCELLGQSYWAGERPRAVTAEGIRNSICFSLYDQQRQIGFARVVTDRATFAWICDVIIHPDFRGQGLGKWLMACVVDYPAIRNMRQILKTRDAHGLYERFGFERGECMNRRSKK